MLRYLSRIRGPRSANEEKREEKKEEREEVSSEEVFDSFGLKKTDNEVEEENDESSANTGARLGKEDGDEEEDAGGGVEMGREFFFCSVTKKERQREKGDKVSRKPVGLTKSGEDTILNILNPEFLVNTKMF